MTDNFNIYRDYIDEQFKSSILPENDTYFVVELLRRGKDNPNMPAVNYHFKNYYIRKVEDLDKYENEIKLLCDTLRLRAYVSVNYKSFKQVSLDTMAEIARRIANNDFKKTYAVFESCSGQYCHSGNKRWVVDLDNCKVDDLYVTCIEDYINNCDPIGINKIIIRIPTRSGIHLITKPFNVKQFFDKCEIHTEIPEIKKNHLTLLYENL